MKVNRLTLWLVPVFEVMLLVIASFFNLRKIFTKKLSKIQQKHKVQGSRHPFHGLWAA